MRISLGLETLAQLEDTETKPYLKERILGGAYFNGVCDVSHNSILFSTILVHTVSLEFQPIFLILVGSKMTQHNKRKFGFKFCFRVFNSKP